MNMHGNRWFFEPVRPSGFVAHPVREVLLSVHTGIQHMEVVETDGSGRALILDGTWQFSELDEAVYHETLVHPAAILHARPEHVLILGGGDGGSLREVLRWRTVRSVTLVEVDAQVVDACRTYFRGMLGGAFEDPRVNVVAGDGYGFLARPSATWDLVIADLTDPDGTDAAQRLYTGAFYRRVRSALRPGGVFATHAGQVGPDAQERRSLARVAGEVAESFAHVLPLCAPVPTYGCTLGFLVASGRPLRPPTDCEAIDRLLAANVAGTLQTVDGAAVVGLLHPPLYVRQALGPRG